MENRILGYWSSLGGVEVTGVVDGIDTRLKCVVNAWYGKKSNHCVKVNYTQGGREYITLYGQRLYLDECIRA